MADEAMESDKAIRLFEEDSESSIGDEGDWLDVEPEEDEPLAIISLLDDCVFHDVKSMLDHCKTKHGFDFLTIRQKLGLDFYGTVKLVNFIRQHVHDGISLPEAITLEAMEDDRFLKPVVDDDALILSLDELDIGDPVQDAASSNLTAPSSHELVARNTRLEEELAELQSQYQSYRLAVEQTLERRWESVPSSSTESRSETKAAKDDSHYYWQSYASNDIHETMLKDAVRTDAYRDFIYENKSLFKDKVVLDIGCGTGILSMFCARAGAKSVFAVDKSDIIDKARDNVFRNGLSGVVSCIRGRIEEIELPVKQVDIIVSEWMGYCLLYEAMLPSVLHARDRYLKSDGLLVPSVATIWMGPVSDPEYLADYVSFWDDVYGFTMEGMKIGIYKDARIDVFPSSTLCGRPSQVRHLDLHTIQPADLNFRAGWQSELTKDVGSVDGFLIWFDIFFTTSRHQNVPLGVVGDQSSNAGVTPPIVVFTTGPSGLETHWKQGFLMIDQSEGVSSGKEGMQVSGEIVFEAPENNPRALAMSVSWAAKDTSQRKQTWQLS